MPRDTIVIDIETKNTFADVGRDNFGDLQISVVGVYSYNKDEYIAFEEREMDKLAELLRETELIVGFSITRFDLPVMAKHFDFDLFNIPRIDLLDEIELVSGKRISLDLLAKQNLGYGKTGHGLDAPILFEQGKLDELKKYCLHDVKVTKELYDLAKKQGHLLVPQRDNPEPLKTDFDWKERLLYQRLF
jgi:DEAD/DEAH box helicase domain-containing protein